MKIRFNAIQTQAMVSLLCTLGTYTNIDVEHEEGQSIEIVVWRKGEPVRYRIMGDGYTVEV